MKKARMSGGRSRTRQVRIGSPARKGNRAIMPASTKSARKRELIAEARKAGWRGKSYRKAKRFDQALTRADRAARGLTPVENAAQRVRRTVARLIKRGGK
jgi:hypothetical protein